MQETDGQARELAERLARLESELSTQRDAVASLREDLRRVQDQLPATPWTPPPPQQQPRQAPSMPLRSDGTLPPLHTLVSAEPSPTAPPPRFDAKAERSLENRIGSQWFNRVGILALLIGVAWFLKLAVDNHWIHTTPIGRVLTGLIAGAGVVLWSERFRRKGFGVFSYSLKAVGTGTLYLVLWASVQMYHLLPPAAALTLMIAVTAWNAAMAWWQDAELLAVYALIGGFATPVLLGSGGNHEVFLFSYVLAMDIATVLLLSQKPWQRLLIGSFPATVTYFIGWYIQSWSADQFAVTAIFILLLAAPFVAVALVGKQRESIGEGLLMPLGAATFLSLALYSILQDSGRHACLPWMAVALGALYLLLMRVRREGLAEVMHLAIAVILLTIAIPLKAEGRWITVGWLAEGVVLLGVASRLLGADVQPRVRTLMRWLGSAALALGVVGAAGEWLAAAAAFWNARFATELAALAALAAVIFLARTARGQHDSTWKWTAAVAVVTFNVLAVFAVAREIVTSFASHASGDGGLAEAFTISAWLMVYAAALLAAGFWRRLAFIRWQGLGLLALTIAKVFLYDVRDLSSGYRVMSFLALGVLLMAVSFAYQKDWLGLRIDIADDSANDTTAATTATREAQP